MTPDELAWIRSEFERTKPWIAAALDQYPLRTHEPHHVLELLEAEACQIWPTANSVCITTVTTHPTGLKVFSVWLAGGKLSELKTLNKTLEAYALGVGCKYQTLGGRKGWLRALDGYSVAGVTLFKELA